jgi:hypothetical protein
MDAAAPQIDGEAGEIVAAAPPIAFGAVPAGPAEGEKETAHRMAGRFYVFIPL